MSARPRPNAKPSPATTPKTGTIACTLLDLAGQVKEYCRKRKQLDKSRTKPLWLAQEVRDLEAKLDAAADAAIDRAFVTPPLFPEPEDCRG